jgi:prepilin-type N-terminal cleavage/methylation domain-containing protein
MKSIREFISKTTSDSRFCHSGLSGIFPEEFPTCLPDRQARFACGNDNLCDSNNTTAELFLKKRQMTEILQNSPLKKGDKGDCAFSMPDTTPCTPFSKGESNLRILYSAKKQISNTNGFTLMEVIVVVAIMAIMVGMMVPFFYRVIESNEIELTKERMGDLKKAMAGDQKLIQNGVRTHYGFIGDCGQLPRSTAHTEFEGQYMLSNDLVSPGMGLYPSTCSGSHMPSGYDPNTYKKDAWGNEFVYTPATVSGRRVSAVIKSAGPDGTFGNTDDISDTTDPDLQINETEVTPTNAVQGNLNFVFFKTADDPGPTYSAKITATYIGTISPDTTTDSGCITLNIGAITANEPKPVTQYFSSNFSVKLPIGKIRIKSTLYTTADCSGAGIPSANEMSVFVSDGLNTIILNAPTINYTIP